MQVRRLPPEEDAVRRYTEQLWLPYNRELAATVADHALTDEMDTAALVDAEVDFRLGRLDADDYVAWVVVDSGDDEEAPALPDAGLEPVTDPAVPLADTAGEWVAFLTTELDRCPTVFDQPDRLVIGDIYVTEPYRGTGLARDLVDLAADRARACDCGELALDVDVDNERAIAFYEKLGFEPRRHRMRVAVDAL